MVYQYAFFANLYSNDVFIFVCLRHESVYSFFFLCVIRLIPKSPVFSNVAKNIDISLTRFSLNIRPVES
jgi:hypothetical protein